MQNLQIISETNTTTQTNLHIRIIGIDPGLVSLGIACGTYDLVTQHLTVLTTILLTPRNTANKKLRSLAKFAGNDIAAVQVIEDEIRPIFTQFKPDYIASESAFMQYRRPNAYKPLVLAIHTVGRVAAFYSNTPKSIANFAPKFIKRTFATSGCATKKEMDEQLLHHINYHKDITIPSVSDLYMKAISEHEIDAIAVAYTLAKTLQQICKIQQIQLTDDDAVMKRLTHIAKNMHTRP